MQELADRSSSSDNDDDGENGLQFDRVSSSTAILKEFDNSPMKNRQVTLEIRALSAILCTIKPYPAEGMSTTPLEHR